MATAPEGPDPAPAPATDPATPQPGGPYARPEWTAYPPPGYGLPPHPGTVYPPPAAPWPPAYGQPYSGSGTPAGPPPGPGYVPPGWGSWPHAGTAVRRSPGTPGQRRGGFAGGLMAALAAIAKLGYLGKFGITAITMVVAVAAYSLIFGWAFALGIVLLIFVHEMGHFLVSRLMGVPMSAPVFIPFLGAFTAAGSGLTRDRRVEAIVAIAGPVFGFLATLAVYLWALNQPAPTQAVRFVISLSYFGFFITLFNLIPMLPLDGGRVTSAISKWFNVAGLVLIGALLVSEVAGATIGNPILILIFVMGAYSVWGRFRTGAEAPALSWRARVAIGFAYIALVALSGLLMSLSVAWLTSHTGLTLT